jgi:hypothetical protein
MEQYLTPRDLVFFITSFVIVFFVFRHYPIQEVQTTICTLAVMWILWHWHVHARQKSMEEMTEEIDALRNAGIPLQSILDTNDPSFIQVVRELLRFSKYNEIEFENGVIHLDNFLRLYFDVTKRKVVYSAHHTQNAKAEKQKTLNSFMGIMSSTPMYTNQELGQHFELLQNPLDLGLYRAVHALDHVLERYLREMATRATQEWKEGKNRNDSPVYLKRPEPADFPSMASSNVFV